VIARFKSTPESVPDLKWEIKELVVAGNRVVVRGEATGTPVRPVFGLTPTGRSFKVMSLDMHMIEGNKIVRTYHLENWTVAARQLAGN
jgi:predicted ester cyclase